MDMNNRKKLDVYQESARFLSLMANEKRLQILVILSNRELNVGQLSQAVGLTQSALSQHLAKLRAAKMVSTRREAQTIYYACHSGAVIKFIELIEDIYGVEFV